MRFFETVFTGAALVSAVFGLTIDTFPVNVVAGTTYTITYSPKDNTPTTFVLRQGSDPKNLATLDTLTTTATGGSFQWTPAKSLVNQPNYALQIVQGTINNYSGLIALTGGSASAVSQSASSSSVPASSVPASSVSASSSRASASSSVSAAFTASVSSSSVSTSRASSTTASPTSGSTPPQSTGNAASSISSSPIAAIIGAIAAFAYLA